MLSRGNRLDAQLIPQLAYRGQKTELGWCDLRFMPSSSLSKPQFAISISKKVDKRATVRNRIKRQIRAAIQLCLHNGEVKLGLYLFVVKNTNLPTDNTVLTAQIKQAISS